MRMKRAVSKHLAVLDISCFCWSGDPGFWYTMFSPYLGIFWAFNEISVSSHFECGRILLDVRLLFTKWQVLFEPQVLFASFYCAIYCYFAWWTETKKFDITEPEVPVIHIHSHHHHHHHHLHPSPSPSHTISPSSSAADSVTSKWWDVWKVWLSIDVPTV